MADRASAGKLKAQPQKARQLSKQGIGFLWRDTKSLPAADAQSGFREGLFIKRNSCVHHEHRAFGTSLSGLTLMDDTVAVSVKANSTILHRYETGLEPKNNRGLISVDVRSGAFIAMDPQHDPEVNAWLAQSLDGEMLDWLYEGWSQLVGVPSPTVAPDVRRLDWSLGQMLPFGQVFIYDRQDFYVVRDKTYLVEDLYCMNPECSCGDYKFVAFALDPKGTTGTQAVSFGAKLTHLGVSITDVPTAVEDELLAHRLWHLINARHNLRQRLFDRHARLMDLLPQILLAAKPATPPKPAPPARPTLDWASIPRNAPCPCGSGKKFKRCCITAGNAVLGRAS